MKIRQAVRRVLAENQILAILLAIILGLVLPNIFRPLNAYSTELLILVFFLSSLRLSLPEMMDYAKDWRMLLIATGFMLFVLPLALSLPFLWLDPQWGLALLIIGSMPTGMTIALIADFFGGKTSLALLITVATSLLAPLTIPIAINVGIGASLKLPIVRMMWSLVLTIVIPFILATLVQHAVPKIITRHDRVIRGSSILFFSLLIAGIVAGTGGQTIQTIQWSHIGILAAAVSWLGLLVWISYYIVPWRPRPDRITIALCMMYLNNTLALFIGDKFFSETGVMPILIILLLSVNVLLPFLKWEASRITQNKPSLRQHLRQRRLARKQS